MIRLFKIGVLLVMLCMMNSAFAQPPFVNSSVDDSTLSTNSLRLVFTMRLTQWPDGAPVRVFVLPDDHPLHRSFTKTWLGLFPHHLRRIWDRLTFSGTGQAPITVFSIEEMQQRLATTDGAIGYLPEGIENDKVKALHVN